MRIWVQRLLASAVVVSLSAAALADDAPGAAPPDAAATPLPDLTFTPKPRDIRNYTEYFYFHKQGITAATALADIRECATYSQHLAPFAPISKFVPYGRDAGKVDSPIMANAFAMWGLVGVAIVGFIVSDQQDSMKRGNDRRCMQYKGYKRYGLSSDLWSKVSKGKPEEAEQRWAAIAAGPVPANEAIAP